MEHCVAQFAGANNPVGVGPFFGRCAKLGLRCTKLSVVWCDKQRLAIKQTLTWLCPPVNEEEGLRVKDPDTGEYVLIYILEYFKRGVKLLVQKIVAEKNKSVTAKNSPAKSTPKKRKLVTKSPTGTPSKKSRGKHWRERSPAPRGRIVTRYHRRKHTSVVRQLDVGADDEDSDEVDEDGEDGEGVKADIRWKRFRRNSFCDDGEHGARLGGDIGEVVTSSGR